MSLYQKLSLWLGGVVEGRFGVQDDTLCSAEGTTKTKINSYYKKISCRRAEKRIGVERK